MFARLEAAFLPPPTEPYVRLPHTAPTSCVTANAVYAPARLSREPALVQYVLCWCVFPLPPPFAPPLARCPRDASAVGFLRFAGFMLL